MPMATESEGRVDLMTSREPKGPKRAGDKGTMGDIAFKDALLVVVVAWLVLFFLAYTLRRNNI